MPFQPWFVNEFVQISAIRITTLGYVIDGAEFYQLRDGEYSFSQQKITVYWRIVCLRKGNHTKKPLKPHSTG